MRVLGWQILARNESEGKFDLLRWERGHSVLCCTIDRSGYFLKDLSKSISVGTRKKVNYA